MTGLMLGVYDEFKEEEGVNQYLAANVELQNTVNVPVLVRNIFNFIRQSHHSDQDFVQNNYKMFLQ